VKPCLLALIALALATAAASDVRAGDVDEDADGGVQAVAAPPPYVDRLIDGGGLAPQSSAGGDSRYDDGGSPRYLRVRGVVSGSSGAGASQNEDGLVVNAGIDTASYGSLSLAGTLRAAPFGGSLAIIERGLPFDGGWSANNGLGTIYSPQIGLAATQYRFFLPTFPMAGASTEWLRAGSLQLQASVGEAGQFDGLQLDGFQRLGGLLAAAAGQWEIDRHWTAGVQVVDASGVKTPELVGGEFGLTAAPVVAAAVTKTDSVSTYAGLGWRNGEDRDQLNFTVSDNGQGPAALGAWFDGTLARGRVTQNYGAFRLQPNLSWGYLPISNDTEGVYYRAAYRGQQWLFDGGVDSARSISGAGVGGTLFNGDVRYQFDPTTGIGGALTYRISNPDGGEGDLYAEGRDRLGQWRLDFQGSYDNGDTLARITIDQTWTLPVGQRLTTSLFVTRERRDGLGSIGGGGEISGGGHLVGPISWEGNFSYDSTTGAGSTGNINADIGLSAKLGSRWALVASYLDDRNQNANLFGVTPIVAVPLTPLITHSSAFLLSLRYEITAGSRPPVLGGSGVGSGAISGVLFLDARGDGVREPDKAGPSDVTILLDGRYATRTDAKGRFEFPLVSRGPHDITVVTDNLPLPWMVVDGGRRTVTVHTRERVEVEIAATSGANPPPPPATVASALPTTPRPDVFAAVR